MATSILTGSSNNDSLNSEWLKVLEIKNAFTFAVEQKRNTKEIKSSLEAKALIYFKEKDLKKISDTQDLSEILLCANTDISDDFDDQFLFNSEKRNIGVKISKADGDKCPRCWKIHNQTEKHVFLCKRCASVINEN